jgi:SAM-dependent methyltransferase
MVKRTASSVDTNKDVILAALRKLLPSEGTVLEVGSGTGQHAAYFAQQMPQLIWQPTDLEENLPGIRAWAEEVALPNLRPALALDLLHDEWPVSSAHAVVCINTVHIVAWQGVENLFAGAGRILPPGGVMYVYGAYRYATRPLEPSNEEFDRWLKARDSVSGVRDFEAVNALAAQNGLMLAGDEPVPVNNRSINWVKR